MKGNFGILLAFAWVLLTFSGCAVYDIERCEAGVCSKAHITSPRKFKSIELSYDGEARTFILRAGDVGTDTNAIQILASIIQQQQQVPD